MNAKFIPTNKMITHYGLKDKDQEGYHRSPEGGIFVRLSSNLWYFVGDEREIAAEDLKAIFYNDKHPVNPGLFRGGIPGFGRLDTKFRTVVVPQMGKTEGGECPIKPIEEHDEDAIIGHLRLFPNGEIRGQTDPEMVKRINSSLSDMTVHEPGIPAARRPRPDSGVKREPMHEMVERSLTGGRFEHLETRIFKMDPESIAERALLAGVDTCHDPAPSVLSGKAAVKFLETKEWLELSKVIQKRDHYLARNLAAGGMSYPTVGSGSKDPRTFVNQLFSDVVSFIEGKESGFELRALENGLRSFDWARPIESNLYDYVKGHSKEAVELSGLHDGTKEVKTIAYPGPKEPAEEWFESFGHALLRWAKTQEIIWPLSGSEIGGGYSCTSAKTITHPVDFAAIIAQNHGHKNIKSAVRELYARLRA